ncbi:MAG TPA: response regulator, partial [Bacteroidetes bacterium]|nr:response regulator [Bacteroidota bacterium]
IAHDFNNLLTVISGHTEMAMMDLDPQDPLRNDLQEVQKASVRAADLTRQLLAFSRKQTLQPKILNLNDVITNLDKMLRRVIGEDIDLKIISGEDLWNVEADPGQIEQIIINLAVNARDAMPDGGQMVIETQNVELDEEYAKTHADVVPGPHVMLAISDTGCGMTDEVRMQIFDPFYTTKEEGKGTGLGLSTVYGIVKQSGGNIWVYSEPGKGTAFKVYLPMVAKEADKLSLDADMGDLPRGTETILVVEDEDGVRKLACRSLKKQGYKIIQAANGGEALMIARELEKPVDLLVTDVIMPHMGGVVLVKNLHEIWPDVKVLYMSGYTANAIAHSGVLDPDKPFIQKPFHPIDLVRKVRKVLDD